MESFKAYFKKEVLESIRQSRYIIFAAGFVLWALLNALMLKVLPVFMASQFPDELLELLKVDRLDAMKNFMGDLYTMGSLFLIFPLMGVMADEIGRQRLMLPYSKGVDQKGLILAKTLHYTLLVFVVVFLGLIVNRYYTHILFEGATVPYLDVIASSGLAMLFFAFLVSFLIFMSSMFKKGIVAGLIVLVSTYVMQFLGGAESLRNYNPYYLFQRATDIGNSYDGTTTPIIIFTVLVIIALNVLTIYRMKKIEVV